MEEEAKLSVGHCLVNGMTSRELKELGLFSRWKIDEYDEKIKLTRGKNEKEGLMKQKAKVVADMYFEHLSNLIVKNDFKLDGKKLSDYIGSLSDDDVKIIEEAVNKASSVSREEAEDFQEPHEASALAVSSSANYCGSSGSLTSSSSVGV